MLFKTDWHEDAVNKAPEQRASVADTVFSIASHNATMHLFDGKAHDHVTVSVYNIAEGLAHNWWNIFGGRDREFSLFEYRSGFIVPDIRLSFDGAAFEVNAHEKIYQTPDIRFWGNASEVLNRNAAESALSKFIESVLDRLKSRDLPHTSAALRWARVLESQRDQDEAIFCEAAGSLGIDPYEIDESNTVLIERAAALFSSEPLAEFLAGARAATSDKTALLNWVETSEARPKYKSLIGDLRSITKQVSENDISNGRTESWALGYRRAASLRKTLNLNNSDRFRSFVPLAEKLGARRSYTTASHVDGIRALRSDQGDGVHIHLRDHGNSHNATSTRLFSFARAVGDVVCFPDETLSSVNDLHSAYRQAAGRAFAAEFLAPISEIDSMREDGKDEISLADEFFVPPTVIDRQLENRGRIAAALASA